MNAFLTLAHFCLSKNQNIKTVDDSCLSDNFKKEKRNLDRRKINQGLMLHSLGYSFKIEIDKILFM